MESTEKRQISIHLKCLLNEDIKITTKFLKFADRAFGPLTKFSTIFKGLEISCHGIPWFLVSASFMFLFDSPIIRQLALNIFIALLIDIVIVTIVKATTRRRRPVGNKMDMFATYSVDKFSFPSGHATRALMLSVLFFMQCSLIFPFSILWSGAVCLSRILMQRHHILDVFGGVVIGIIEALFIVNFVWLSSESSQAVIAYFLNEVHGGPSYDV